MIPELSTAFNRLQGRALAVGIAGGAALAVGSLIATRQFFQSYLYGWLFWALLTLGFLGVLLLHHLVSGSWGHLTQRLLEAGTLTLPLMALLFIPVLLGLRDLYPWTHQTAVEVSPVVAKKAGYLNTPFFILRTAVYFLIWIAAGAGLARLSRKQDGSADPAITRRMKLISGPAMVVFVLTVTLASVDWMMSLEPEWFSTIYGMSTITGAVLGALAVLIIAVRLLERREPFASLLNARTTHHLGNLLFAFTILWAYMAFSQFLLIWSGNLPEESSWYIRRMGNGWTAIAIVLIIGHFFVPFLLLLSRRRKKFIRSLARVAAGILIMRFIDIFWLIVPAFTGGDFALSWMDFAAPLAIGGLWIALFVNRLKGSPLVPLHDDRFVNGQSIYQH